MSAQTYLHALKNLGIVEVAGIDAGYYQGDYFAAVMDQDYFGSSVYEEEDRIGLLVFGYGSCSGCDAWEGAESASDRLEVLTRIVGLIKWFDDLAAMKAYLASNDPELEWYGHEEEWAEFVAKVNALKDYNELSS